MRWLIDFFKEYQLSSVLRERISLAEKELDKKKAEAEALRKERDDLKREVEQLRSQVASDVDHSDLSQETCRVLIYLFRADGDDCETGLMTDELQMEQGVTKYHLDLLQEHGLAQCIGGNVTDGSVYWELTPKGRRYVVERGLLERPS